MAPHIQRVFFLGMLPWGLAGMVDGLVWRSMHTVVSRPDAPGHALSRACRGAYYFIKVGLRRSTPSVTLVGFVDVTLGSETQTAEMLTSAI